MKDIVHKPSGHQEVVSTNPSKLFPTDLWNSLVNFSLPRMVGREGFENHTWTAVNLAFQVSQASIREGIVEHDVSKWLVTLAFLHDLGYSQTRFDIYNRDQSGISVSAKREHQKKSAVLAIKFLRENDSFAKHFSNDEQARLTQIIGVHDSLDEYGGFNHSDQILLHLFNEVDTMAAIDMMFGKPSFSKDKIISWMAKNPLKNRVPKFITDFSKQKYIDLASKITEYVNNPSTS